MSARKTPELKNYFSGAKQSQQLSEAETEIQQLKTEIEQLRDLGSKELEEQLQALRGQLKLQSGVMSVALEQIHRNQEQPRQTFLPESIESMSRSLATHGQLEPIILIPHGDTYLLFDGERRWRSAQKLGWKSIQAVVISEPADLHRKALLTSLHREDLTPLDKAEAILREISTNTGLAAEDIPRILSTVVRRLNAQKRMSQVVEWMTAPPKEQQQSLLGLGLNESEQAVLSGLLELQLNPASIDANIFPMLSLVPDLKAAIRESGLFGFHAIALQKLSAKNLELSEEKAQAIRVDATHKVIEEKLSISETRRLVSELIAARAKATPKQPKKVKQVFDATQSLQKVSNKMLAQVESSQLEELQAVLQQKLAEIEEVLKQKNPL